MTKEKKQNKKNKEIDYQKLKEKMESAGEPKVKKKPNDKKSTK